MCGLVGFCSYQVGQFEQSTLKKMTDVLIHRGPDDAGYQLINQQEYQVGLGHRRLSILDLSSAGQQPMTFQHLVMSYNGEVYNFQEIRKELRDAGYSFQSESDSEVILKSFYHWGLSCVHKFVGMFSIAIYDTNTEQIYLIRDRVGVKPLYYFWDNRVFIFGSELKAFYQNPYFLKYRKIDYSSLSLFLQYSYIPGPYTIFENTYKLSPGHVLNLKISKRELKTQKYWDVNDYYQRGPLDISEHEAIDTTEALLKKSYAYRMVSDVPVGVFLSGGYDSVSVAAMLQSELTQKLSTFSIGFHEQDFNEATYASEIAKYLGTNHHEYYITPKEASEILPMLPEIYDEPFADNSTVPTALLCKFTSKHVKVALSGDGGDEIFGGYHKFNQSIRLSNMYFRPLSVLLSKAMDLINPEQIPYANQRYNFSTRYEKVKNIFGEGGAVAAMKQISQYVTEKEAKGYFLKDVAQYSTEFDNTNISDSVNDKLSELLAVDYKTFLVDNNLVKIDRATMAFSLEGREPMLDHRIIEFVSRLPSQYKINNGTNKYILKEIVHKYVPKHLMDRPKMPFIAPLNVWFRDQLVDQMKNQLSYESIKQAGSLQS